MRFKQKQKHMKGLKTVGRIGGLLFIVLSAVALTTTNASAQTLTTLYSFTGGSDGATPYAGVIADASGNLYGTTFFGGASGWGTVFKLTPTGTETVLYTFTGGSDGAYPQAGLIADASGNLYGTTQYGGGAGRGAVFKLTPTGTETVLYSFTGGSDGGGPQAGLIADASGNLYGTTELGGANDFGTVFKLTPTGTETVLYSFTGGSDGGEPVAVLIADASGNLYGTTWGGGSLSCYEGCGVVFELANSSGIYTEKVLYSFKGGTDGSNPYAGLIADASGNLYGTTNGDGANHAGTVFKLTPTGTETVLYSFTGGSDGGYPYAGVIADASGNLYGTTTYSGDLSGCSGVGCGVVFKLTPTGSETVLYSFTGSSDGWYPFAGALIADASGNLYGTTEYGGANNTGTVFKLSGSGFALPTPLASLSPTSLSFGSQTLGTTSGAQTVTLTNTGRASLHVTSAAVTSGFTTTNNCVKASPLAANGSCTESVTFAPTTTGAQTGSVTFTDDSGGTAGSTQAVSLSGTGTAPVAGLSPSGLTFAGQVVGTTSAAQTVTLSNSGTAALTIAGITVNGSFAETNNCGSSLAAGSSCAINVTFTPTATGTSNGTLTVTDNSNGVAGSTQTASLSGTGLAAFTISPNPSTETVKRGVLGGFILTLQSLDGFKGNVALSCSGGPAGSYCLDLPQTVYLNGTAYAISGILFPKNTTPGTYTISFTGTSGSLSAQATATFIVE